MQRLPNETRTTYTETENQASTGINTDRTFQEWSNAESDC